MADTFSILIDDLENANENALSRKHGFGKVVESITAIWDHVVQDRPLLEAELVRAKVALTKFGDNVRYSSPPNLMPISRIERILQDLEAASSIDERRDASIELNELFADHSTKPGNSTMTRVASLGLTADAEHVFDSQMTAIEEAVDELGAYYERDELQFRLTLLVTYLVCNGQWPTGEHLERITALQNRHLRMIMEGVFREIIPGVKNRENLNDPFRFTQLALARLRREVFEVRFDPDSTPVTNQPHGLIGFLDSLLPAKVELGKRIANTQAEVSLAIETFGPVVRKKFGR